MANTWHALSVHLNFVSDKPMAVPIRADAPCEGTRQFTRRGIENKHDAFHEQNVNEEEAPQQPENDGGVVTVRSVAVDDVVRGQDVLLLKVDIEGAEIGALRSAMQMFRTRQIHNMIIEFGPVNFL